MVRHGWSAVSTIATISKTNSRIVSFISPRANYLQTKPEPYQTEKTQSSLAKAPQGSALIPLRTRYPWKLSRAPVKAFYFADNSPVLRHHSFFDESPRFSGKSEER